MRTFLALVSTLLLAAFAATAEDADVAAAPPFEPQTQNDVTFLSGGIGQQERDALRALDDYNVRVALTRADGAYLSDIHVVVEDADGKPLIDTTTRGPIFLAELAPGRYRIQASTDGRTTERRVIDVPTERDQVRLYVALEEAGESASKQQ